MPRRDDTWFLAPPAAWSEGRIVLPPNESHHALRALRLRRGHEVTVSDGAGAVARCVIEGTADDRVIASVLERDLRPHARPELAVFQGAAKGGKNDAVVERLAEIGVAEAWIYESRRTVVKWDSMKSARLAARWEAIAQAAAKQSRNPYVMKTAAPVTWTELVRRVRSETRAVVLWEEAEMPLRDALGAPAERIACVVGPEGGLAVEEANELAAAGAALVSLGPNVLRTENAAVVAAAAIGYHFGLLG